MLATLGDTPPKVDPNPELPRGVGGARPHPAALIIDVQPYLRYATGEHPQGLAVGEKRPALLCCHGHGPFGKEPVMGNQTTQELRQEIADHGYNYGEVMAQKGFVTYAIDWIGFGERNDSQKPNHLSVARVRDWCNLYWPARHDVRDDLPID